MKKLKRGRLEKPCPVGACCCLIVAVAWCCCCGCYGSVEAVVTVDAVVSQCVRAYNVYRLTCKFVVAAVVAVEIRVRACIMCRPWTQICRFIFGSAIFSSNHQETDGRTDVWNV